MKSRLIKSLTILSLVFGLLLIPSAVFADGEIDISNASVSNCTAAKVYTGKAIKPAPVVFWEGLTLTEGQDYTVTYKNNLNVGTASVTVKGKGAYTGTIKKTFRINPKGSTFTKSTRSHQYVTLTWSKRAARMSKNRITGYQVRYARNTAFNNSKPKYFKGYTKTSGKITGLTAGTTYYFQIRTYMKLDKKTYYSKWSAPLTVKTKSYDTPDGVIYGAVKAGKFVYSSAGGNIYKVNVNTNKKTLLAKSAASTLSSFSIHNGYLYYIREYYSGGARNYPIQLCRTSRTTGNTTVIANAIEYYVKGGKLYFTRYRYTPGAGHYYPDDDYYDDYTVDNWMCANLDGSGVSDTGIYGSKYAGTYKNCNVTGYRNIYKSGGAFTSKVYLRKPNKKLIYLGKETASDGVPNSEIYDIYFYDAEDRDSYYYD
ncbi:MAG: fibronectin type III domain-containing protein [Mogibacterium sp.]|nr:fibronectin type III domain-containing protein [Mogibacterium sp.]